jgi:hypothetical protein
MGIGNPWKSCFVNEHKKKERKEGGEKRLKINK